MTVSVGVLTYNHGPFIGKVIESILDQKTDFPFEIIVCDDCSTDETVAEATEYSRKHPDKVRVITSTTNKGVYQNSLKLIDACLGEFVAMVDGDDWWTSKEKLQRQVDALRSDENAIGCFHDAEIVLTDDEGNTVDYYKGFKLYSQVHLFHPICHPWDIVERTIIPTSSLVFRNQRIALRDELVKYQHVKLSLVWVYHLMLAKHGHFIYINEPWCVYNNNKNGLTKMVQRPDFISSNINVLRSLFNDSYFRNLKHHIYRSLATEISHYLFANPQELTFFKKVSLIWQFNVYSILYAVSRSFSLLKRT